MIRKVLFTWSGGKDSALALYELQRKHDHEILALLTTLTEDYDRVSMHGVRKSGTFVQSVPGKEECRFMSRISLFVSPGGIWWKR